MNIIYAYNISEYSISNSAESLYKFTHLLTYECCELIDLDILKWIMCIILHLLVYKRLQKQNKCLMFFLEDGSLCELFSLDYSSAFELYYITEELLIFNQHYRIGSVS